MVENNTALVKKKTENAGQAQQAAAQNQAASGSENVTLTTKFISGLKGDVSDNIFFLDDTQVVYPVGHNIVIYHTEEKTQRAF